MKNVFIEGIQGMGKSTLLQDIYTRIPEFHVCREGDYSPVDLAWCAWMTEEEYQLILEQYDVLRKEIVENTVQEGNHYIVSYTKIITDIPGFHKELERFEIYNERKTLQELEEIIVSRYRNFSGTGYLFECAFMQNIVEDLILFHQLSDDEIIAFYRRLYNILQKEDFLLLYLYSDEIEESTKAIRAERSDNQGNTLWYDMMMAYLVNSPYGQKCGYKGFDDLVTHFRHRQRVELRIISEVLGEHARILPAKQWNADEVIHLIRDYKITLKCTVDEVKIRRMMPEEYPLLEDFLYDAIYLPEGASKPPREIIRQPELSVYIDYFGQMNDLCLVAEAEGHILGAVWTRILAGEIKGYGNVDAHTPEFAISVKKEFRQLGIGSKLMREMIALLKSKGYRKASLSVNKDNYACQMYGKMGFRVIKEREEDYLMLLELSGLP